MTAHMADPAAGPRAGAAPARFTDEAWAGIASLRTAIDQLPFLRALEDGSLPRETFVYYMAQDAHYLADFGRALAACASQSSAADELLFWAGSATAVVAVERQLHGTYVADLTAGEKSPTCTAYTSYLLALSAAGSYPELAAALLPCFWIYEDVGTRLQDRVGDLAAHPYGDWIGTYGDPAFTESTRRARQIVDGIAAGAAEAVRDRMHAAFRRAAQYEWMFWDAAGRRETWPV